MKKTCKFDTHIYLIFHYVKIVKNYRQWYFWRKSWLKW